MSLIRTLNTLRYLRPGQVTNRIGRRLQALLEPKQAFFRRPVPPFPGCQWQGERSFLPPRFENNTADRINAGHYRFINQEEHLNWPPADWSAPGKSLLWQYNLHYCDWLWAMDWPEVKTGISHWVNHYPLANGQVGWEPYPISLRLMNWCALCFGRHGEQLPADEEFRELLWQSTYRQAEWLSRHLEKHLLGNHLLENAAALIFAGSTFAGSTGKTWLGKGLAIMARELPEQILPDGMHFERSPMYHLRVAWLLKLLCDTGNDAVVNLVEPYAKQARSALALLCHPDGQIALFSDSAFAIYNDPAQLLQAEKAPPIGAFALSAAGYYGFRDEQGTYLLFDAGPLGPDYIPGHAHGDIFSFELSLRGERVIVDSGVYDYVPGDMRSYCRSTAAHNTVTVNGLDQGEFWGAFRLGHRGCPKQVTWSGGIDQLRVSGHHDGFRRAPGNPLHYRSLTWESSKGLKITDRVKSSRPVHSVSRLHLHPSCLITQLDGKTAVLAAPAGPFRIAFSGQGQLTRENTFYCPEFGLKKANLTLAWTCHEANSDSTFTITKI